MQGNQSFIKTSQHPAGHEISLKMLILTGLNKSQVSNNSLLRQKEADLK